MVNKCLNKKNVEVKKILFCSCRYVSSSTHYFLHMHVCVKCRFHCLYKFLVNIL